MSAAPAFRYRGLSSAALTVTNLDRALAFYRDIVGLDAARDDDGGARLRCGGKHHDLVLHEGREPGLRYVAFELESAADWERARKHFAALGLAPRAFDGGALGHDRAFAIRVPTADLELRYLADAHPVPDAFTPTLTQIVRLGHIVIQVRDYAAVHAFLTGPANFRVSDHVEGKFAFLRCFPNPLHHSFAIGGGAENRLHHVNFMVSDIDDIGRAMNRLKQAGVEIVFGPGRHLPSGSIFLYFLDPDGLTLEFSFGMEEFGEHDARDARPLEPKPEVLDTWGSVPAERFAKVGIIEAAHG